MKHLFRLRRVLIGIWISCFFIAVMLNTYLILMYSFSIYGFKLDFIITIIIFTIIILLSMGISFYLYLRKRNISYRKSLFNLLFIDCEPAKAINIMKDDLTIHTYLNNLPLEESVLNNVLFHFFYGNIQKAKVLIIHLREKFLDKLKANRVNYLLFLKSECLIASMLDDDFEEYHLKRKELDEYLNGISSIKKIDFDYPDFRLTRLFFHIDKCINELNLNKTKIYLYLEKQSFFDNFEIYTLLGFLIYHRVIDDEYYLQKFSRKNNSLFEYLRLVQ